MGHACLPTQSWNSIQYPRLPPSCNLRPCCLCVLCNCFYLHWHENIFYRKLVISDMNHWNNLWSVMRSWCLTLLLHTWDLIPLIYYGHEFGACESLDCQQFKSSLVKAHQICVIMDHSRLHTVPGVWLDVSSQLLLHPQIQHSGSKQSLYISPTNQPPRNQLNSNGETEPSWYTTIISLLWQNRKCSNQQLLAREFHSCLPKQAWFQHQQPTHTWQI